MLTRSQSNSFSLTDTQSFPPLNQPIKPSGKPMNHQSIATNESQSSNPEITINDVTPHRQKIGESRKVDPIVREPAISPADTSLNESTNKPINQTTKAKPKRSNRANITSIVDKKDDDVIDDDVIDEDDDVIPINSFDCQTDQSTNKQSNKSSNAISTNKPTNTPSSDQQEEDDTAEQPETLAPTNHPNKAKQSMINQFFKPQPSNGSSTIDPPISQTINQLTRQDDQGDQSIDRSTAQTSIKARVPDQINLACSKETNKEAATVETNLQTLENEIEQTIDDILASSETQPLSAPQKELPKTQSAITPQPKPTSVATPAPPKPTRPASTQQQSTQQSNSLIQPTFEQPIQPSPYLGTIERNEKRRIYTINYALAHEQGVTTDEHKRSIKLTLHAQNDLGARFVHALQMSQVNRLDSLTSLSDTLHNMVQTPLIPKALLVSHDCIEQIIKETEDNTENRSLNEWAKTLALLLDTKSVNDPLLKSLQINPAPTGVDFPTVVRFSEILDSSSYISPYASMNSHTTVAIRLVFKSRAIMLIMAALFNQYQSLTNHHFIAELVKKTPALHQSNVTRPNYIMSKQKANQMINQLQVGLLGVKVSTHPDLAGVVKQPALVPSLAMIVESGEVRYACHSITGLRRSAEGYLYIPHSKLPIPHTEDLAQQQICSFVRFHPAFRTTETAIIMPNISYKLNRGEINVITRHSNSKLLSKLKDHWNHHQGFIATEIEVKVREQGIAICKHCHAPDHSVKECPLYQKALSERTSPVSHEPVILPALCAYCDNLNEPDHTCKAITEHKCRTCGFVGHGSVSGQCPMRTNRWRILSPSSNHNTEEQNNQRVNHQAPNTAKHANHVPTASAWATKPNILTQPQSPPISQSVQQPQPVFAETRLTTLEVALRELKEEIAKKDQIIEALLAENRALKSSFSSSTCASTMNIVPTQVHSQQTADPTISDAHVLTAPSINQHPHALSISNNQPALSTSEFQHLMNQQIASNKPQTGTAESTSPPSAPQQQSYRSGSSNERRHRTYRQRGNTDTREICHPYSSTTRSQPVQNQPASLQPTKLQPLAPLVFSLPTLMPMNQSIAVPPQPTIQSTPSISSLTPQQYQVISLLLNVLQSLNPAFPSPSSTQQTEING